MNSIETRSEQQNEALRRINDEFDCWLWAELIACPVQLYGNIDGRFVDFYARGSVWTLTIGDDFEKRGTTEDDYGASWLEPDAMETILREAFTEYGSK